MLPDAVLVPFVLDGWPSVVYIVVTSIRTILHYRVMCHMRGHGVLELVSAPPFGFSQSCCAWWCCCSGGVEIDGYGGNNRPRVHKEVTIFVFMSDS
jgi:hypothetical protein